MHLVSLAGPARPDRADWPFAFDGGRDDPHRVLVQVFARALRPADAPGRLHARAGSGPTTNAISASST